MSKKVYKEVKKYKRFEIIFLLGFLICGLTYRFVDKLVVKQSITDAQFYSYLGMIVLFAGVLFYLFQLQYSVRVSKKNLRLKYSPLRIKSLKIRLEDIIGYRSIANSEASLWCGWNVNYDSNTFGIDGKDGIELTTKKGDTYFVESGNTRALIAALDNVLGSKKVNKAENIH